MKEFQSRDKKAQARLASQFKGKNILITGAGGFVGSALFAGLSGVSCKITLLSHAVIKKAHQKFRAKVKYVVGDVAQQKTWENILMGVDVIFHLAAYEHQRGSIFDPQQDLKANAQSVLLMLEACRVKKIFPRIIFSSSANLFGITKKIPVDESFRDDPLTLFSIHKLMAEKYLEFYGQEFGIFGITLRLANLYGLSENYQTNMRPVLNRIMEKALRGGPLTLFRNSDKIRDYLYLGDAINALLVAGATGKLKKGGKFVIGSGQKISIKSAIRYIALVAGKFTKNKVAVNLDPSAKISLMEMRDFVADSSLFTTITGWRPLVPLREGIERTMNFFSVYVK